MWYERPGRKLLYAMAGMIVCLAGCAGKGDAAVNTDMPAQTLADPTADIKTGVSYDTTGVSDSAAETSRVVTDFSDVAGEVVLPYEDIYSYELSASEDYIVITGITEKYKGAGFREIMSKLREEYNLRVEMTYMVMPDEIDGIPVKAIGDGAFKDTDLSAYTVKIPDTVERIGKEAFMNCNIRELELSENIETIGESAFENCALSFVHFPGHAFVAEKRAFAGNTGLNKVLIPDGGTVLKEEVFAACDERFLLCYGAGSRVGPGAGSDDTENTVMAYAEENGLESVAVLYPVEPIVRFHDEVIVLTPEVKNFFYGEDVDYESEKWCSWEADENAPNFGYEDWQAPGCSTWCGVGYFEQKAAASSELPSGTGRYAASNVLVQNREKAWAEGAEGPGIGESITYYQACDVYGNSVENSVLNEITWDDREPEHDGLMRYTEICIVNGYAKDLKTWEENGRIKRLIMYIDDRPYAYLELEDTILPQYFALPEDDIIVMNGKTLTVRFEIADVYPGTLYEDTCLTGLVMEFAGRYAH